MSINARRSERSTRAHYEAGELIGGKYRLVRKIGEGSMGAVWVATNVALDSKVAIKLLNPDLRSASALNRFLREARSSAMLDHPAIVRVYDLGAEGGGEPFIVMELLAGESLGAHLQRVGSMGAEPAVQLVLPIAAAIEMAHQHGVVHRDLKPDNIMLAEVYGGRLQPKVVDFGVAKLKWGTPNGSGKSTTGVAVIGTPDYMSPEQASGMGMLDHHADIWSLSVVLYEAIAGRSPFTRDQVWATLHAVVEEPAPSLVGTGSVDADLWAILKRGLEKSPLDRWPSMRAFGEALAGWLESRGVLDDVCGTSLRANWLIAPARVSGATVTESPKSAPPGSRARASATSTRPLRKRWAAAAGAAALAAVAVGAWQAGPVLASYQRTANPTDGAGRPISEAAVLATPNVADPWSGAVDEGVKGATPSEGPDAGLAQIADARGPAAADAGARPAAAAVKPRHLNAQRAFAGGSKLALARPTAAGTAPVAGDYFARPHDVTPAAANVATTQTAPEGTSDAGAPGPPALPDPL